MKSILHIAEKPSVAKSLATTLSNKTAQQLRSKSKFNPIFSFVNIASNPLDTRIIKPISKGLIALLKDMYRNK